MARRFGLIVAAALVAAVPGLAHGQGPKGKAPPKAGEMAAYFHDGTVLRRVVLQDEVELVTKYGKLKVPLADVRRILFGHRLSEEQVRKIDALVRQLGSEKYEQREAAGRELVQLGARAYPALQTAAKSTDKEVSVRAAAALERIREEVPEEDLQFRTDDVVHVKDSVITGRIQASVLKARTENFGELQMKLSDLRSLRTTTVAQSQVTVDAAQHSEKWMDTGIVIEGDAGLVVEASGQVDLSPGMPGQVVSGPEGSTAVGRGRFLPGTLLGRIGEQGEVFLVGKRLEARIAREGKLYLMVMPLVGGGPGGGAGGTPSGNYKVSVRTGPELARGKGAPATMTSGPVSPFGPTRTRPQRGGFGRGGAGGGDGGM